MRGRTGRSAWVAAPLRALLQRFAFLLLLAAAIGLLILSRSERPLVDRTRAVIADIAAENQASLRVARKLGMKWVGYDASDGRRYERYRLERSDFLAG